MRRLRLINRTGPKNSEGFTLVESLVSLIVLSLGILGLGQLFSFSLQTSNASYLKTIAHTQAIDMAERIWLDIANPLSQVEDWKEDHQNTLPGWEGEVAQDPDDMEVYQIRVRWAGTGRGGTDYTYYLRLPNLSAGGSE